MMLADATFLGLDNSLAAWLIWIGMIGLFPFAIAILSIPRLPAHIVAAIMSIVWLPVCAVAYPLTFLSRGMTGASRLEDVAPKGFLSTIVPLWFLAGLGILWGTYVIRRLIEWRYPQWAKTTNEYRRQPPGFPVIMDRPEASGQAENSGSDQAGKAGPSNGQHTDDSNQIAGILQGRPIPRKPPQ